MGSSSHEDYLLRQLKAMSAVLARIFHLRTSGQLDEARTELQQAYGLLLGSEDDLARRVDPGTAAQVLGRPERIAAYARLVQEEAAQARDAAEASALRQRALELGLEAALRGALDEDLSRFITEIAGGIDEQRLRSEHQAALARILNDSRARGDPHALEDT